MITAMIKACKKVDIAYIFLAGIIIIIFILSFITSKTPGTRPAVPPLRLCEHKCHDSLSGKTDYVCVKACLDVSK